MTGKKRENWGSKIGFIMATAGSAVGLGSLWKFPYVTGMNGGGAFVLLYLIFTFLIAIPLFVAELIIGRHTARGPISAFAKLGRGPWKYLGWLAVGTAFLVFSYYNVVAGWTLHYAFLALTRFSSGLTGDQISGAFDALYTSPFLNVFWCGAFIAFTSIIIYAGVQKGIEFWSRILMPALFIILIGLFIYSMTLPGFPQAFDFIFAPHWEALKPSVVVKALGLSFFTVSVGFGILVTYGSYMRQGDDIPKTACIIGSIGTGVSVIAGMMIFPVIFSFGLEPQGGPGLVFKTLPLLFEKLPATFLISTSFFLLLIFATVTSTISLMEVLVASLIEILHMKRHRATIAAALAIFLFGIPSALAGSDVSLFDWQGFFGATFFDTIENLTDLWLLPISGLLITIFTGWCLDKKMLRDEFVHGAPVTGKLFGFWMFLIKWIVPIAILVVILQNAGVVDVDKIFNL